MIFIMNVFFPLSRAVSTTVDPFRDISLDLAPSSIINRTSTPFETNGKCVCVYVCVGMELWNKSNPGIGLSSGDTQMDNGSPASTNSGETLLSSIPVPSTLDDCLERCTNCVNYYSVYQSSWCRILCFCYCDLQVHSSWESWYWAQDQVQQVPQLPGQST